MNKLLEANNITAEEIIFCLRSKAYERVDSIQRVCKCCEMIGNCTIENKNRSTCTVCKAKIKPGDSHGEISFWEGYTLKTYYLCIKHAQIFKKNKEEELEIILRTEKGGAK